MVETKRKILVIDDDEDINNYLKIVLKKYHYVVEVSSTIEDFFKKAIVFGPNLCLVDLNLENHNGFGFKIVETFRRKLGDKVSLIVMSRRNTPEDVIQALELGANDYITKPIDELILINKIHTLFGREVDDDLGLPYYAVPTGKRDSDFSFEIVIHQVRETGLTLFCPHYIAKGTLLTLNGEYIKKITGLDEYRFTIKEVNRSNDYGGYLLFVEYDTVDEHRFITESRKILLTNHPIKNEA